MGAAIGFYDGFFGPGTGSFLIFLFIRFRAGFSARLGRGQGGEPGHQLGGAVVLLPSGQVMLAIGIPMAVANVAGAVAGTRMALRGGTPLIRKLFLVLVIVLIGKMGWDLLR